jgi:hypothetical protein
MNQIDNVFMTRLKRVNRLRAAVSNGSLSMREVLEEAERVLTKDIRWLKSC